MLAEGVAPRGSFLGRDDSSEEGCSKGLGAGVVLQGDEVAVEVENFWRGGGVQAVGDEESGEDGATAFRVVFGHGGAEGLLGAGLVAAHGEDVCAEEVGFGALVTGAEPIDDEVGKGPLSLDAGEEAVGFGIGCGECVGGGESLPRREGFFPLAEGGANLGEMAEGGGMIGTEAQGGLQAHQCFVHPPFACPGFGMAYEFPALAGGPFAVNPLAARGDAPEEEKDGEGNPKNAAAKDFLNKRFTASTAQWVKDRHGTGTVKRGVFCASQRGQSAGSKSAPREEESGCQEFFRLSPRRF